MVLVLWMRVWMCSFGVFWGEWERKQTDGKVDFKDIVRQTHISTEQCSHHRCRGYNKEKAPQYQNQHFHARSISKAYTFRTKLAYLFCKEQEVRDKDPLFQQVSGVTVKTGSRTWVWESRPSAQSVWRAIDGRRHSKDRRQSFAQTVDKISIVDSEHDSGLGDRSNQEEMPLRQVLGVFETRPRFSEARSILLSSKKEPWLDAWKILVTGHMGRTSSWFSKQLCVDEIMVVACTKQSHTHWHIWLGDDTFCLPPHTVGCLEIRVDTIAGMFVYEWVTWYHKQEISR